MYYVITRKIGGVKTYYIGGNKWGNEWLSKKYTLKKANKTATAWWMYDDVSIEQARDLNAVIESLETKWEASAKQATKEKEALKEKLEKYEGLDFLYTKACGNNGYLSKKVTELKEDNAELTEMGANLCAENNKLQAKLDGIFSVISGKKIGTNAGEPCNRYGCDGRMMSYPINDAFHCCKCGSYKNKTERVGTKEGKGGDTDNDPIEMYTCPECKDSKTLGHCSDEDCYNYVPF